MMMEQIGDLQRVVEDIKKQSKLKSHDLIDSNDYEGNYEIRLQNSESHLSDLKIKCTRMETKSLFLEYLAKDSKDWPLIEEVEEEIESLKAERKQDKIAIEEVENNMEELAEELQTKNDELKKAILSLEAKLANIKEKKKQYEDLKEKSEKSLQRIKDRGSLRQNLKEIEEKHLQADFAITQCTTAISSLEHYIEMMRTDLGELQSHVSELKKDLHVAEEQKRKTDEQMIEETQWLTGAIKMLEHLGGLSIKEVNDDSVMLEIFNSKPGDDNKQRASLLLTLSFRLSATKPRLCGAEVNLETFSIVDLVPAAVETGDLVALVHQVKKRFNDYNALREEMEELQKNYAVDWEPSLGRLRVMVGKSGNTVCTLGVDSSYPATGSITLLGVESKKENIEKDTLMPPSSCVCLSEWVKHLLGIFSC
ncbi:intracellular protein transport protein USO1-like [Actinia tenebrosa]|uniref:Intracellular protein transport protein USO1-like n=1 Tax=Actinia tenebrosa TaxID=6105 RepID=A0A6P8IU47_ACTTE|nr:intracellular protein transport protein USO1-like [Actinia tenebrosa]XP_031570771.1 intracellular protein transport protein USO1-like [Actinia tenebrosa]